MAVFIPKLQTQFAEFLSMVYLKRLRILFLPTCVGFGTDYIHLSLETFLGSIESITLWATLSSSNLGLTNEWIFLFIIPTFLNQDIHHLDDLSSCVIPSQYI
jgi:hypothetical protein